MSREHDIREQLRELDREYNEAAREVGDISDGSLTPDQQRRSSDFSRRQHQINQERTELEKELWSERQRQKEGH